MRSIKQHSSSDMSDSQFGQHHCWSFLNVASLEDHQFKAWALSSPYDPLSWQIRRGFSDVPAKSSEGIVERNTSSVLEHVLIYK